MAEDYQRSSIQDTTLLDLLHEELTIEDGLVLKGTRIIIPDKKREEILKLIHEGHLGLNKCKMRAKETVYWPGMNEAIRTINTKLPTLSKVFKIKR